MQSLEQFLSEVQSKSEDSTSDDDENEDDDSDHKIDVQLLILVCLLCDDKKAHRKAVSLAQKDLMVSSCYVGGCKFVPFGTCLFDFLFNSIQLAIVPYFIIQL